MASGEKLVNCEPPKLLGPTSIDPDLGSLLLSDLVFDCLFKQPYVIIGIRQHVLSAIRDDGSPTNLDSVHDIHRMIDKGHRDCRAFVVIDPHRGKPKLPSLWICNSLLISGISRHGKAKRSAQLTSHYVSRQSDAVDGYAGLGGLTECCRGQQDNKRQAFHAYEGNNLLNWVNDPFAVRIIRYRYRVCLDLAPASTIHR